jgi:HEAT repeat protein
MDLTAPADDRSAGAAWLASPVGTIRITAAAALARTQGKAAVPGLLAILDDPIAYYRMWTLFALESALGRRLSPREYDPLAAPARRAAQLRQLQR